MRVRKLRCCAQNTGHVYVRRDAADDIMFTPRTVTQIQENGRQIFPAERAWSLYNFPAPRQKIKPRS